MSADRPRSREALEGMLRHIKREFQAGKLGVRVSVPTENGRAFDRFTEADVDRELAALEVGDD